MSILSDIQGVVADVVSLILPRRCIVCGGELLDNEGHICLPCRYNVPLTDFAKNKINPIKILFENNRWLFAQKMGEWLGEELKCSGNYEDVDVIIPIPLHYRRRLQRGYNQSEQLAIGIGRRIGVRCDFRSVYRRHYNDSQTSKRHTDRWDNVETIFEVRRAERLRGKHILLVDDVLTTGATIGSCATTIIKACEGDVRISVATLAASKRVIRDM